VDLTFSAALADLSAYDHVVPAQHRAAARELAALIFLGGREVDADRLNDLIHNVAPQHRSAAYAVLAAYNRASPKARDEIASWARVLLLFRGGGVEAWEKAGQRPRRRHFGF
jgi:hypothetical protein